MFKYLIEFTRFKATVIAQYNDRGLLEKIKINYGDMPDKNVVNLLSLLPKQCEEVLKFKDFPNVKVSEIPFDTSFVMFWNTYDHKFGNKSRSERLWNALNEESRIKAIKHIQLYNQYLLQNAGVSKKLPETYLNQKPWDN